MFCFLACEVLCLWEGCGNAWECFWNHYTSFTQMTMCCVGNGVSHHYQQQTQSSIEKLAHNRVIREVPQKRDMTVGLILVGENVLLRVA